MKPTTAKKAFPYTCTHCGAKVRFDGEVEGHLMYIDKGRTRTCEKLGGGEETPAHAITLADALRDLNETLETLDLRDCMMAAAN
jgi:hypothetical protein